MPALTNASGPVVQDLPKRDDKQKAIDDFLRPFNEPIRICESKPVTVNDAQFVLVAQTNWKPGKTAHPNEPVLSPMVAPVEIQLRITNLGEKDVIFPTFHTLGLKILDLTGKEAKSRRIQKGDSATRPLRIPAGAFYSVCPCADLRWDEESKASQFYFRDGTGSQVIFGPLHPGRYQLTVSYTVSRTDHEEPKAGEPLVWRGNAVTGEVAIEILDGTARGEPPAPERYATTNTEPINVRASEAVTVNDAKFVVIAQADWKPERQKVVPVELQLHITNLGKVDRIFPTFDTFDVVVTDSAEERVVVRGGRDLTAMTRPVLIPAGTSFALAGQGGARGAGFLSTELRWNPEAKAVELRYFDGTGSVRVFGPLQPGRYNIGFWYWVSEIGPLKSTRNANTWIGSVATPKAAADLFDK